MNRLLIGDVYLWGTQKDILIEGEYIVDVVDHSDTYVSTHRDKNTQFIDGKNFAAIPGFANMHTHAAMTLMRGSQEDSRLKQWLKSIWKQEAKLDEELIYYGTKLACIEMLKTGTTLYNDQYFMASVAQKANNEIGIRAHHSHVFLDLGDKKNILKQREECEKMYADSKKWGKLSSFDISVHAPYTVSKENIIWAKDFANKHNLNIHIHIAETGQERLDSLRKYKLSPVAYLNELDLYSKNVIAAHCIWIDEHDIEILGQNKVNIVHNINSNLKLASGYKFKYQELIDSGANVCIGTDGCASSNNLDMLEAVKTTALVQKAWRKDPSSIPVKTLLNSSTINGYNAFGLKGGKIAKGYLADLLLININNYSFTPNINFLANLIYSAHSDCVDTVICNGQIVMKNRVVKGEEEVLDKVNKLYKKLI